MTAAQPQVLVVGAGALGLTCAYHLQRAGAAISLLVRPHRMAALSRPQRLYRYDNHSLQLLDGFSVLGDPGELLGRRFDFVLLTLDGATCRSEQGIATLRDLGTAIAGTGAGLVICGVGLGLYDHVRSTTGLDAAQLLQGTMKIFAYQVGSPAAPQPPAARAALHDSADIAYLQFPDGVGFVMAARPKAAARAFAALYDASGEVSCKLLPAAVYQATTSMFSPFILASALDGWRGTQSLLADPQLWPLCCRAQREILRLQQFGPVGRLLALLLTDASLAKKMRATDRDAAPMGYTAFNRFHHGAKMLAQNVQIVENCIEAGERAGRDMPAARALLARYQALD